MSAGLGVWTVRAGGEEVARLVVVEGDYPWLTARVEAGPAFAPLRPLFAAELAALDGRDDETGAWEAAYARVRAAAALHYPDGLAVPDFVLHVDGDTAWWRWSDEPAG